MSGLRFQFGDTVRHVKRPEWGIGSITRAEDICVNGKTAQRLNIRFPNAGLKTLNSNVALLEVYDAKDQTTSANGTSSIDELDQMGESGWLAPMARKKIEEVMLSLPLDTRDVFNSLRKRLKVALDLYRFDDSGKGLIDWAVAQSQLDDPLSRFNRHELEHLYGRWSHERDLHLTRLLHEARDEPALIRELMEAAPAAAREAFRRIGATR